VGCASVSLAEKLLEELKSDERVREEFLAFVAEGVARDRRARLVVLQGLLREVATKSDVESTRNELRAEIEALRSEFREEVKSLEARISSLEQRVARLEGSINLFIKLFIAFNLSLLVSVIAALVTLLLRAH
jgi:polyhydroxyalkanoate synthesis regulator phasin